MSEQAANSAAQGSVVNTGRHTVYVDPEEARLMLATLLEKGQANEPVVQD